MNLKRIAAHTLTAGVVATTAAFGFAGPAQAVTSNGCTATPLKPAFSHLNAAGKKVLRYTFRVSCGGLRSVAIQHQVREKDVLTSQLIKNTTFTRSFLVAGARTINVYSTVPNTEIGAEEMFHRLRIKVTVAGVPKPSSGWHSSAVVSI